MYKKRMTRDPYWIFTRNEFNPEKIKLNETLFTLGNGYIGSRGVLAECHEESYPGTYIAGIYNRIDDDPAEIVNCPNPLKIEIHIDGKPINCTTIKVLEHTRKLDIKKALLYRKTIFEFNGKEFYYETFRFFSMSDLHTGVLSFNIKALSEDAQIVVKRLIDGQQENEFRAENEPLKHFTVTEKSEKGDIAYLESITRDQEQTIGMALCTKANFKKSCFLK